MNIFNYEYLDSSDIEKLNNQLIKEKEIKLKDENSSSKQVITSLNQQKKDAYYELYNKLEDYYKKFYAKAFNILNDISTKEYIIKEIISTFSNNKEIEIYLKNNYFKINKNFYNEYQYYNSSNDTEKTSKNTINTDLLNNDFNINTSSISNIQDAYETTLNHLEYIVDYYYKKYNWKAYNILLNPDNKMIIIQFLNDEYDLNFKELEKLKIKYNTLNNDYNKYYKQKKKDFDYAIDKAIGTALGIVWVIIMAPYYFLKGFLKK